MATKTINMYDSITEEELNKILPALQWTKQQPQKYDNCADDGQANFVTACYSDVQSWGATDYNDHRKDSVSELKKLIEKSFRIGLSQRGHFYDSDGKPVNTIVVRGYLGGYTGNFVYKSGRTAFNRQSA